MTGALPRKILGYPVPGYMLVAASSWLSRILTTAISLITIRILLNTLGVEHYAVYVVLMGAASWFMMADLGMGQSLQNYISEARANKNEYTQDILATAAITLAVATIGVAVVVMLGGWPAAHLLSQFRFLSNKEKYQSFASIASLVIMTAGGSIIYRIWYAENRGYLANIATACAAVISLAGLYCVAQSNVDNKLLWCLIVANAPMAALPVGSLLIRLWTTNRIGTEGKNENAKKILHRGSKFWLFNIAAAAVFQIDYIVLSQYASADQIIIYSIGAKIFATMAFMTGAVLQAFWPACAEAVVKGDWQQIKSFTRQYLIWSIAGVIVFTILLSTFNVQVASIFTSNDKINIPIPFIILMGVMYVIRIWTDVFAVILQSMNDLKMLLKWAVLQAAIGLSFQILLVPKYGIYGTVVALCISWLSTVSWLLPRRVWQHQQKMLKGQA